MKTKTLIRKDLCTLMFIVALFKIAKTQKQPTCALIDEWIQKMWGVYNTGYCGLPCWLSGEEPACQCKSRRFNPCVSKILWRWKWQPISVFLPGKSHGQRILVGYNPWGTKESYTV